MNNNNRDVRIIEQRNKSERQREMCLCHSERDRAVIAEGWMFVMLWAFTGVSNYSTSTVPPSTQIFTHTHTSLCVSAHSNISQAYSTFICDCGRGIKNPLIKMILTLAARHFLIKYFLSSMASLSSFYIVIFLMGTVRNNIKCLFYLFFCIISF